MLVTYQSIWQVSRHIKKGEEIKVPELHDARGSQTFVQLGENEVSSAGTGGLLLCSRA